MLKRFVLPLLVLAFAIGCGSPSPSTVVKNFYIAIEKGDMETLGKCATPEAAGMIAPYLAKVQPMLKAKGKIKSMKETIDNDTATVEITFENGETSTENLVKVDGKWRVTTSGSGK